MLSLKQFIADFDGEKDFRCAAFLSLIGNSGLNARHRAMGGV